ncbi:geranyl transferase, partial [Vibrio vulnificus]
WKAILAGDALLTKAFELVSYDSALSDTKKVKVIQRLAFASGHLGMVGGQTLDMQSEDKAIDISTLESIHRTKTGALLTFAIMSAVDIADTDEHTSAML